MQEIKQDEVKHNSENFIADWEQKFSNTDFSIFFNKKKFA